MRDLRKWILAISPTTLLSSFTGVTLGAIASFYVKGVFDVLLYALTLLGVMAIQAGINLVHDYYDYLSGVDILYRASGFSHRPHPIIDFGLNAKSVLKAGYSLTAVGLLAGTALAFIRGLDILALGVVGVLIGLGYSVPPLKLHYRGLGEVMAALAIGPLLAWGSFVVQTGDWPCPAPLILGLINGGSTLLALTTTGVLEYEACRRVGKRTLVLILGLRRVPLLALTSLILMFLPIPLSVALGYLPPYSLAALVIIPRAYVMARPLLKGLDLKDNWHLIRGIWTGPFGVRTLILIVLIASVIMAHFSGGTTSS